MKLTYEQKKELAEWIAYKNNAAVTGSIMLKERGVEIGREPNDIDIVISEDIDADNIILPPFVCKKERQKNDKGYSVFARCWVFDTKIEFITDNSSLANASTDGFNTKYCSVKDLLRAKKEYIEQDVDEGYINKTKRDIKVIKKYQKQFPIIRYRVAYNGVMEKLVCRDKIHGFYKFSVYDITECNEFEDWRINENKPGSFSGFSYLFSETSGFGMYSDFEEAKKVSKEKWDKVVAPNALYRVLRRFDDVFDGYLSDPMSKKEATEKLNEYKHSRKEYLYSYDIVKVD